MCESMTPAPDESIPTLRDLAGFCDPYCMAPFGSHHERCQLPSDHDGGRVGCNHMGGFCSERPSQLGSR